MSQPRPQRRVARPRATTALAGVLTGLLVSASGCTIGTTDETPKAAAPVAATPSASPTTVPPLESQFTRDGTYQSHIDYQGMDFVYTVYPTKSTPRTNEWYARGDKYFSFTFQAYDMTRRLRDKFATKRKAYLERIVVRTQTVSPSGATISPYELSANARKITFDPEPLVDPRYGMLITSPKGAFELRNQRLTAMPDDTTGVIIKFAAVVHVQDSATEPTYRRIVVREEVPVSIFKSDLMTIASPIPENAN